MSTINIILLEIGCPGDGSCSFHGTCDDNTGTCLCNDGFDGENCQSMFKSLIF
jgi:hypothetical protein